MCSSGRKAGSSASSSTHSARAGDDASSTCRSLMWTRLSNGSPFDAWIAPPRSVLTTVVIDPAIRPTITATDPRVPAARHPLGLDHDVTVVDTDARARVGDEHGHLREGDRFVAARLLVALRLVDPP